MGELIALNRQTPAIHYLTQKDSRLCRLIDLIGEIKYQPYEDGYSFLVSTIIGQMLSNKVVDVLFQRIIDMCGGVSPEIMCNIDAEQLRKIGISYRKSNTISELTQAVISRDLDLYKLYSLTDEAVIRTLTSIKGIGMWTAKMYLIFVLDRPDILPFEDGAFLQSYCWLYHTQECSPKDVKERCRIWSPYSSYAARFLYKALDSGLTKKS